jgi:hypothetical protein
MFYGEIKKALNLRWMRVMDKYLILTLPFENIGEEASQTKTIIIDFGPEKPIVNCEGSKSGELRQV